MGKSKYDFDDLQAEENRRKASAVLAGASPRAERYADSPIKDMIQKYHERTIAPEKEELEKWRNDNPDPRYNMASEDPKVREQNRKTVEQLEDQLEEANKNEFKVTDTSTGLPKPEPRYTPEQQQEIELAQQNRVRLREQGHLASKGANLVTPTKPSTPLTSAKSSESKSSEHK